MIACRAKGCFLKRYLFNSWSFRPKGNKPHRMNFNGRVFYVFPGFARISWNLTSTLIIYQLHAWVVQEAWLILIFCVRLRVGGCCDKIGTLQELPFFETARSVISGHDWTPLDPNEHFNNGRANSLFLWQAIMASNCYELRGLARDSLGVVLTRTAAIVWNKNTCIYIYIYMCVYIVNL